MTPTIQQVSEKLQTLFIHDAQAIGRSSGFIQRERKLNGASFAQSLIFGWQANPQASLEDLRQSAGVCRVQISPQGMQERLNSPEANTFLYQLFTQALGYGWKPTANARICWFSSTAFTFKIVAKLSYRPYLSRSGRAMKAVKRR